MKLVFVMGISAPLQLVQKLRIVLCSFPWAKYLTPKYYMHGVVNAYNTFLWDVEPTLELIISR
jgi:hypothetical protein